MKNIVWNIVFIILCIPTLIWCKIQSVKNKIFEWLKRNPCKECEYYIAINNTCQSKKCATCGCHPYVNWFDRHFCDACKSGEE